MTSLHLIRNEASQHNTYSESVVTVFSINLLSYTNLQTPRKAKIPQLKILPPSSQWRQFASISGGSLPPSPTYALTDSENR